MSIQSRFTDTQLTRILEQSMLYQCACPAQVCRTLLNLRELHKYQSECLDRTDTDRQVHEAIASSSELAHMEMENCLLEILEYEGWDMKTLSMPAALQKAMIGEN